jgi:hypothetical protein
LTFFNTLSDKNWLYFLYKSESQTYDSASIVKAISIHTV